jgi:predicted transcriptional regulator
MLIGVKSGTMIDNRDNPDELLEPIAYLARSQNRLRVLETLTEDIPKPGLDPPGYEPRELRARTEASEATVNRILNEFRDRGWAERDTAGEYTATALGQGIAIGIAPIIDSMEAIHHLGEALSILPLNELSIDLGHFRDATVREPQGPQPVDFGEYLSDVLDGCSSYYFLTYALGPPNIEGVDFTELDQVMILAEHTIDYQGAATGRTPREQIETGDEVYSYHGHIPCNIMICDETVVFENGQVDGIRVGTAIESRNETVRNWAFDVFDRYRNAAEEITLEDSDP